MTASSTPTDLLAYNFNLETTDFIAGQSFLHELAREGDVLSAEVIIDSGGGVDLHDDQGKRPLHEAAFFGHDAMAELLIASGATIDAPVHPFGHTALYLAIERGHGGVARMLIDKGASLAVQDRLSGQGLLHIAAARGDMRLAGFLISAGIDVFLEDRKGQTARDTAAKNGHRELERTLLKVMAHHARG